MIYLYPWKFESRGAKALAREINAPIIRHEGSRFVGRPRKVVINWGASRCPDEVLRSTVLNTPLRVRYMTNKVNFFRLVGDKARTVPWTTDKLVAKGWQKDGHDVVVRHIIDGHGGAGIQLAHPGDYLRLAPLYTKYTPKMSEFRVHIVNGVVIDTQRKAARTDLPAEQVDWQIRNLDGGFIYSRQNVIVPRDVIKQALDAFKVSGLHFGAVDVIWNQKLKQAYVLEINTAPGLEGQTVVLYSQALKELSNALLDM